MAGVQYSGTTPGANGLPVGVNFAAPTSNLTNGAPQSGITYPQDQQPFAITGNGSSGVLGASTTANPSTAAVGTHSANQYYDSLQSGVQTQLDRLPAQDTIGTKNINDAYNSSYNTLLGQNNIATRNYNTSKDQTLQDNVATHGDIQAGVGQTANSLQRLLGAHGAGNSSAARVAAPYAAARTGAIQNNQVQKAFGRNQQALDTNFGDYTQGFNTGVKDLAHQRDTQTQGLESSIAQNKASLLSQLASIAQQRAQAKPGATQADVIAAAAPYQSQINQLGTQIDQLGQQYAQPVLQTNTPAYQAPTLESYDYTKAAAPILNDNGVSSNINPFLNVLLNPQDKNKQSNLNGALA
jgi:hypothetical protein